MKNKSRLVFIFFLVILIMTGGKLSAEAERFGGELIVGQGASIDTLDPHQTTSGFSANALVNIYDGLVRFRPNSTRVEPALATSWQTEKDGQIWTFKLREDVFFHDGKKLDADAVVFNFERQLDAEHPYHSPGSFPYAHQSLGMIEKIEKLDEYTIRFTLQQPYAPFLKNLAMFSSRIVSPDSIKEEANNTKTFAGTGPFIIKEWDKGDKLVLTANEDYWNGRPYLDQLVFEVIKDREERMAALMENKIDLVKEVPPSEIENVKQNSDLEIQESAGMNLNYIALHNQKPPFNNKKIRQAINYAINKEEIADELFKGAAEPTRGPLPGEMWGYEQLVGYPHNPERAAQLLAEAGYEDGFEFTLRTYDVPRPYNPLADAVAEKVKEDLGEVGIEVNIERLSWTEHIRGGMAGEHQAALFGWITDNGDPDNFLNILLHSANQGSTNRSFYQNDEVDELLIEGQSNMEVTERQKLYHKAQRLIVEDAPIVFLTNKKSVVAYNQRVNNFITHPTENTYFHNVWVIEEN
ncbi:MAG: ABC transporter substrate-binding protein [Halanaerobiales bacterium]